MLRLHHEGVSARQIGRTLGAARSTIQDNLERAATAGVAWPLAPALTDDVLEPTSVLESRCPARAAPAQRARLGASGARDEAARGQPDGAVGGVPRGAPQRLWL